MSLGVDPTALLNTKSVVEQIMWRAVVVEAEVKRHELGKSHAAQIANAVWGKS